MRDISLYDFKVYDCSTNKTSDSRNAIYKDITEHNYATLISFRLLNPYAVILLNLKNKLQV